MKTIEEELGKVSLTCNGQWNDRPYERLCIVHDGFYASYISRKAVPAGIPLSNEEYWQPIAKLREDLVIDYETFKKEIKLIDIAIEREIRGLNPNAFIILQSIDGIGPVFAGGIVAEIGDISAFHSSDALAKYAGLMWKSNQSGDFDGEDTPMSKAGNRYLRYYLGEAANSMRKHNVEYGAYYRKKYNEVPKHQHKRALALTSRKFVRLVYGLLARNQLYSGVSLDTSNE